MKEGILHINLCGQDNIGRRYSYQNLLGERPLLVPNEFLYMTSIIATMGLPCTVFRGNQMIWSFNVTQDKEKWCRIKDNIWLKLTFADEPGPGLPPRPCPCPPMVFTGSSLNIHTCTCIYACRSTDPYVTDGIHPCPSHRTTQVHMVSFMKNYSHSIIPCFKNPQGSESLP